MTLVLLKSDPDFQHLTGFNSLLAVLAESSLAKLLSISLLRLTSNHCFLYDFNYF